MTPFNIERASPSPGPSLGIKHTWWDLRGLWNLWDFWDFWGLLGKPPGGCPSNKSWFLDHALPPPHQKKQKLILVKHETLGRGRRREKNRKKMTQVIFLAQPIFFPTPATAQSFMLDQN